MSPPASDFELEHALGDAARDDRSEQPRLLERAIGFRQPRQRVACELGEERERVG